MFKMLLFLIFLMSNNKLKSLLYLLDILINLFIGRFLKIFFLFRKLVILFFKIKSYIFFAIC